MERSRLREIFGILLIIACAMLCNPPILIPEAMTAMMKGRTSFVFAPCLSTIKDSDNILYMQDGDILEVDNHETLMVKDGLYVKLYNSQFSEEN